MLLNNDFIAVLKLVPNLSFDDIFMEIKRPSAVTFSEVILTAADFSVASSDYYNIKIPRKFITENGLYIIQGTAGTVHATIDSVFSTKAKASRPALEFVAVTPGVIGNTIVLNFDGIDTVATVTTAWNMDPLNANNQVTYTGAGATILPITTVSLVGGSDGNPITLDAVTSGPIGNLITLVFDGNTTRDVLAAWNLANPNNLVITAHSLDGFVPAQTLTLAGGTETAFLLENEAFPWGSSKPNTCTIYGTVSDIGGQVQPYAMVDVAIWPLKLPAVNNNTMTLGTRLTTYADSNGNFELVAVIGTTIVIEVPKAGFRLQAVVPNQGSVQLADLIPVVTPTGISVRI